MRKKKSDFLSNAFVRLIIRNLIIAVVALFCVLLVVYAVSGLLKRSDYFIVKEVAFSDRQAQDGAVSFVLGPGKKGAPDLSYLKGRNIFTIDLARESRYISAQNPDYRKVRLVRVLPDRLFLDFSARRPLAILKLSRDICVDEEKVLFEPYAGLDTGNLPFITGLEARIRNPLPGAKYNIRELNLALDIIKEISVNAASRGYAVTRIDVSSLSAASFFMLAPAASVGYTEGHDAAPKAEVIEVKLGAQETKGKIGILADLLSQVKDEQSDIKYIDLRFKDPVIKLKHVK